MTRFPLLSQLTVVIPTFCRPEYLKRNLDLLADHPIRVIVMDGSPSPSFELNGSQNGNVVYIHDPRSLSSRMRRVTGMIETNFVALLADDDLFLPSGLNACLEQLTAHQAAVSAIGRTVRFHHRDGQVYSAIRYDFDKSYVFDPNATPSDLLRTNYGMQYVHYGVFRRDPWATAMDAAHAIDFESPYVAEVAFRSISALRQRSIVVDQLFWLRSDEVVPVETDGESRSFEFSDWVVDPSVAVSREILIDRICELDWGDTGVGTKIRNAMLDFFGSFARTESSRSTRRRRDLIAGATKAVGRLIPRWLRPLVRRCLPRSYRQRTTMGWSWSEMLNELRRREIRFDENELAAVRRVLEPFARSQSR